MLQMLTLASTSQNDTQLSYKAMLRLEYDMMYALRYVKQRRENNLPPVKDYMSAVSTARRWKNHTVWYYMLSGDESLFDKTREDDIVVKPLTYQIREAFEQAAEYWAQRTCLTFAKLPDEIYDFIQNAKGDLPDDIQKDFIIISGGKGAREAESNIGVREPMQGFMWIGEACDNITVVHEIGHTLGLLHTMTRNDRDRYIKIDLHKVLKGYEGNFAVTNAQIDFGNPYDFASTMQYSYESFSAERGRLKTMLPRGRYEVYAYTMGAMVPSFYDVKVVNDLYCSDICTEESRNGTTCFNGGMPDPLQCHKCLCPRGFGGPYCDETPFDCGNMAFRATEVEQMFILRVPASRSYSDRETQTGVFAPEFRRYCGWYLTAPPGQRIYVRVEVYEFQMLRPQICTSSCTQGAVEVKFLLDHRYEGAKICCTKKNALVEVVSEGNFVPILVYSNVFTVTARIYFSLTNESATLTLDDFPGTNATYNPEYEAVLPLGVQYGAAVPSNIERLAPSMALWSLAMVLLMTIVHI